VFWNDCRWCKWLGIRGRSSSTRKVRWRLMLNGGSNSTQYSIASTLMYLRGNDELGGFLPGITGMKSRHLIPTNMWLLRAMQKRLNLKNVALFRQIYFAFLSQRAAKQSLQTIRCENLVRPRLNLFLLKHDLSDSSDGSLVACIMWSLP
jgi:hypothetical protein